MVLLPSGKILSAGGEGSTFDYQIYLPPYFFKSGRPVITGPVTGGTNNDELEVGMSTVYSVPYDLPADGYIEKVVLMRPCSTTHHSDFDQRSVALDQVEGPAGSMHFRAPPSDRVAPTGYYMMFLVSSAGVPSVARWVKVL